MIIDKSGNLQITDIVEKSDFAGIYPQANFTRNSAAYLPDGTSAASGIPRYVNGRFHNLLTANQSNGGEVNLVGFTPRYNATISRDTMEAWEGSSSIKVVTSGIQSSEGIYLMPAAKKENFFPAQSGEVFTASTYVKGEGTIVIAMIENTSLGEYIKINSKQTTLTDQWQRVHVTATMGSTTSLMYVAIWTVDPQAIAYYVDGMQVNKGELIDWRLGGTGKGILIEEGTTNRITSAQQDFITAWSGTSGSTATVTPNQIDPFGGTNAYRIVTSGGTTIAKWLKSIGVSVNGQSYSSSVWVKNNGVNQVEVRLQGGTGTPSRIVTADEGWVEVRLSGVVGNGATSVQLHFRSDDPAKNLDLMAMWPQIEEKAYATSYTNNSRSAETLTIPTTGMSNTKGTIEGWVYVNSAVKRSLINIQPTMFLLRKGNTISSWIWAYWTSSGLNLQVRKEDGTVTVSGSVIPLSEFIDGWHHIAITYTDTSVRLFLNGSVRVSRTGITMPLSYDRLNIGHREGQSADCLGSIIDEVRVSNVVRSDAEIFASYSTTKPHTPDQYTYALLHFDGNLISHEDVKSIVTVSAPMTIMNSTTPTNTSITRQAQTSNDGVTWDPPVKIQSDKIPFIPKRYYREQVTLTTDNPSATPTLSDITVREWSPLDFLDTGLNFTHLSNYIDVPHNSSLDISNSITIEMWVKKGQNTATYETLLSKRINGTSNCNYEVFLHNTTKKLGFYGGGVISTIDATLPYNELCHIAIVTNTTTSTFYINGTLIGVTNVGIGATTTGPLSIGKYSNQYFNGNIYEVRIWNSERSQAQIKDNMYKLLLGNESNLISYWKLNEGSGTTAYDSVSNNNGTIIGARWVTKTQNTPSNIDLTSNPGDVKLISPITTFTRSSTAYLPDGSLVTSGSPRYVPGRFHNLLSKNQSDVEATVTGFMGVGNLPIEMDTLTAWQGVASLKCSPTAGNTLQRAGVTTNNSFRTAVVSGRLYIASAYIKTSIDGKLIYPLMDWYNSSGVRVDANWGTSFTVNSTEWTRVSMTLAAPTNAVSVAIQFGPKTDQGTFDYWIDGLQLEEAVVGQVTPTEWCEGGSGKAILIEEGTTNIVSDNQSNIETDIIGYTTWNDSIISRDTTEKFEGIASLKTVTPGTKVREGWFHSPQINCLPSTTYTGSCMIKGTPGVSIDVQLAASPGGLLVTSKIITLTGEWQRVEVTGTVNPDSNRVYMRVGTTGIIATTFWTDAVQIEQKAYATSWVLGGTTRAAETLTISTTGLSATQGTFEAWVYIDSTIKQRSGAVGIFNIQHPTNGSYALLLYHQSPDRWQVTTRNDSGVPSTITASNSLTPDGWNHFAVIWFGSTIQLFINGIQRATTSTANVSTIFSTSAYIGGWANNSFLNSYMDDIRISAIPRKDSEIAATFAASSPLTTDGNTFALMNFDNNLTISSGGTIITKIIDLGNDNANRTLHLRGEIIEE